MDAMPGYCGLRCSSCPIHLATLESDDEGRRSMRGEIARICRERYGLAIEVDDVGDCDGCQSQRLFVTCAGCGIRKCAREKGLASCAFCDQFACEALQAMFAGDPEARGRLERLRNSR